MEQKSIFITGAASGIGRATAILFARNGWIVGCGDINEQELKKLKDEVNSSRFFTYTLNVVNEKNYIDVLASFWHDSGKRLDILFNNAGIGIMKPFEETSWHEFSKTIDINLIGVFLGIKIALPYLKLTEGSMCISTASASSLFGTAGLAAYSATKHAVKGITESLHIELKEHDIYVTDVMPGIIDSAMIKKELRDTAKRGPWELQPPSAVAEAVLQAWISRERIHWYVPTLLEEFHKETILDPKKVISERIEFYQGVGK